ncbi:MAG: amidohydrolase, partial [Novosphingobium sp.]
MRFARTALAALLLSASPAALADTLIDNVRGTTIGANGQVEQFTGLLFDSAGTVKRVIRAGDKQPKARKDYQYHLDGKGRVMLPGMIDAHVHVMEMGLAALSLDLSDTTS